MKKATVSFRGREDKLDIVGRRFSEWLRNEVLDVGCDQRYIERFVKGRYVGIDVAGKPDVYVDLEIGLPFRDGSFDTVLCFDVLEHTDSAHRVFDELCRVSRQVVIIGLPNMYEWRFRLAHLVGKRISGKYGLPVECPADRHKWFFSAREAREFIHRRGKKNGFRVVEEVWGYYRYQRVIPAIITRVGSLLGDKFANVFAYHYWALLIRDVFPGPVERPSEQAESW